MLPLHVYPSECDRYYDASTDTWYVVKDGEWTWLRNDETPGPIPQGDQAGRASGAT